MAQENTKSKVQGEIIKASLMAFANQENLYDASETFLKDGLGLKLWANNPRTPSEKRLYNPCLNQQKVEKAWNTITCIMPMEGISAMNLKNGRFINGPVPGKHKQIYVYACEAKYRMNRDDISRLTSLFNQLHQAQNCPALVLIRDGQYLHFSTCQRSENEKDESVDNLGKCIILYKIDYKKPRKGHIQILEKLKKDLKSCSTFEEMFLKFQKSLSIDIVSDNFFKEYTKIFREVVKYATDNKKIISIFKAYDDPQKAIRDYVKMLMGRIVFIQFLQRKGWMGVPAGDASWSDGDSEFLQNLFERSSDKDHFVSKILIPLFKDMNEERSDDRAGDWLGEDVKIPYLNGGLFDMDEYKSVKFDLPQDLMKKMLDFFRSYNFTIDENSQDSIEVGVDPEMLSRIFENLLEDNKEKGAFYTPKEIVEHMCRESLTTYLLNGVADNSKKDLYKAFVKEHNADLLSSDDMSYLDGKLRTVKICDPAIGSGAFPMGMLKELYECRKAIEQQSASDIKKDIIQNSIYGVDIEKGAVNIARLRFWLSMIIDEPTPHALPNMDFKIMQGNSLLEQYKGIDLSILELEVEKPKRKGRKKNKIDDSQQELSLYSESSIKNIQSSIKVYYSTTNHEKKITLRNHINDEIKKYILHMKEFSPQIVKELNALDIPNDQFFLWHIYFKEVFDQGGFDIVIGNPPYIELQKLKKINKVYKNCRFETYNSSGDIYCLFTEHGFNILKSGGVLCYIMMNKWMKADYGKELRHYIRSRKIHSIIDYGDVQVFKKATTYPCIIHLEKSEPGETFKSLRLHDNNLTDVELDEFPTSELDDESWVISSRDDQLLYKKLKPKFPKLGEYLGYSSNYGIKTGLSDAFLISKKIRDRLIAESPTAADLIVPYFAGKDIQPYETPSSSNYMILFKKGETYRMMQKSEAREDDAWAFIRSRYPSVCNWLLQFRNEARTRSDKGDFWWELRACSYYAEFARPKIMYQTFQVKPNFIYDEQCSMCNNSMWILPTENKALLGLLNSKIGWWFISCYCSEIQSGHQLIWDYFKRIPIALHDEDKDIADLVDKILAAKAIDSNADISADMHEIDTRLYELYGLTNGEVKVIEANTDDKTETFGADFEPFERKPEFKQVSDDDIHKIYQELKVRFNRICDVPLNGERVVNGEYDLTKTGMPSQEELDYALNEWTCAILTAYRGKKQDLNERRNQELKSKMKDQDLLYRSVDGCYKEINEDGTYTKRIVKELSFFVTNTNSNGDRLNKEGDNEDFFRTIYRLAEHYEQDSFLFTFSGNNRMAFLVATNKNGRSDFRNDIKFAGPLFKNVENLDAWTECSDGKIAFMLKGMIQRWIPNTAIYIGEGDLFDVDTDEHKTDEHKIDEQYRPDVIVLLHDNNSKSLRDSCSEYQKDHNNLIERVFTEDKLSEDEIRSTIQEALDSIPKKTKVIGFHCSASVNGSYEEGARIAFDTVQEWAKDNRTLKKIVIVDVFGDYYKL